MQIVSWHLTEADALQAEASYIRKWGKQLVNQDENHLEWDPVALKRSMALSAEYRATCQEANALSATNPELAIAFYKKAMTLFEGLGILTETGLVGELLANAPKVPRSSGDEQVLDSLTQCLSKLACYEELDQVVSSYLVQFSGPPRNKTRMASILKRHAKARVLIESAGIRIL